MRFNYIGQQARNKCEVCGFPMLGTGEDDPRKWLLPTTSDTTFCDCMDDIIHNAKKVNLKELEAELNLQAKKTAILGSCAHIEFDIAFTLIQELRRCAEALEDIKQYSEVYYSSRAEDTLASLKEKIEP